MKEKKTPGKRTEKIEHILAVTCLFHDCSHLYALHHFLDISQYVLRHLSVVCSQPFAYDLVNQWAM